MKYASKYYPFSFVRAASSPHPRTHTDARHLWLMTVLFTPTLGGSGARGCVSLEPPRRWRPRVTPGYSARTRTRQRRPAERDGASRGHEADEPSREGTQDRRSRTSGESGRPAAHLPPLRTRRTKPRYDKQQYSTSRIKLHGSVFVLLIFAQLKNYFWTILETVFEDFHLETVVKISICTWKSNLEN